MARWTPSYVLWVMPLECENRFSCIDKAALEWLNCHRHHSSRSHQSPSLIKLIKSSPDVNPKSLRRISVYHILVVHIKTNKSMESPWFSLVWVYLEGVKINLCCVIIGTRSSHSDRFRRCCCGTCKTRRVWRGNRGRSTLRAPCRWHYALVLKPKRFKEN